MTKFITQKVFIASDHAGFTLKETIIEVVDIDFYKILMQEVENNKMWIEEYLKNNKPKKKLDKKKLNKDIIEIDFMCD
jgi:hypothetical protein